MKKREKSESIKIIDRRMRYLIVAIIATLVYFQGIRPVIADYWFLKHKQGNKEALSKALSWSPDNSLMQIEAGQIDRVAQWQTGDLTEYSIWYIMAIRQFQAGNTQGGIAALNKSLWLYPDFAPAKDIKRQIEEAQSKK